MDVRAKSINCVVNDRSSRLLFKDALNSKSGKTSVTTFTISLLGNYVMSIIHTGHSLNNDEDSIRK